ncbi:g2745 [Coccomyxa viridis]|uniref:G2745 protein n=1 Tax=Coccomyxa viridis TaxID=1274662 RepID=A0ABP1FNG1_9CHLO
MALYHGLDADALIEPHCPEFARRVHETLSDESTEVTERIGSHAQASASTSSPEEVAWLCEALKALVQPDSQWYNWKYGSKIHYRQKGRSGPRILLIHGFGVGSFQFIPLMEQLAVDHQVWALDLLGQGLSWPSAEALAEDELRLSMDTWTELLADFVTSIVQRPVYVAGNSLGGYLACNLAANHSSLCLGALYLNATPFWAFTPSTSDRGIPAQILRAVVPYDGVMPAPEGLKSLIRRLWWDFFIQEDTIRTVLQQVYIDRSAADTRLLSNILAATAHELAVDAMVSIIFSPGTSQPFGRLAASLRVPSCLIYGREDPWVKPVWGQRLKRLVPKAAYFEISPAGHCPHDEAPDAVTHCMKDWITSVEDSTEPSLAVGSELTIASKGQQIRVRHVSGEARTVLERVVEIFHRAGDAFTGWRRH